MGESLPHGAYDYLVEKLASGDMPPGSRLSNRALASEIGVSVIPVREAISRLQSEGLVKHEPGIGSFVPQPCDEELLDIYGLREAVECHAVREMRGTVSEETLNELMHSVDIWAGIVGKCEDAGWSNCDPALFKQWASADASFHNAIVSASGNRRALQIIENLRKLSCVFGTLVGTRPRAVFLQSLESHRRILGALRQGNTEEAARLLAEHIQNGCQRDIVDVIRRKRMVGTRKRERDHGGRRRRRALPT
jgi:DNA-binding GntR family transcriptional regulator